MFGYSDYNTASQLETFLERYRRSERPIQVDFRRLIPELNGPDRATHLLHPYPAKLLPHIPFFFLANPLFSREGDLIADPFCGSGTVLLEGQLSGRIPIGADINPFARLLSQAKTTPVAQDHLRSAAKRLLSRIPCKAKRSLPDVVNLEYWFYPHVIEKLLCISEAISATRTAEIRDFFRICLSNCARRVSLADPRLTVPVRLNCEKYPSSHPLRAKTESHLRRLRRVNVSSEFERVLERACGRLERLSGVRSELPRATVNASDARSPRTYGQQLRCNSEAIQLIITSPPYPGAQKYIRSCSLSLGWLDLCEASELRRYKQQTIGREEFHSSDTRAPIATGLKTPDRLVRAIHRENPVRAAVAATYICEMRDAIEAMHRALCPGGHLVLVAANNQIAGREFRTQDYLRQIAENSGMTTVLRLVDDIRSRGLMTKRNKTASMIAREWVLVFRKEA